MKIHAFLFSLLFPQARCLACDEPRRLESGQALCAACRDSLMAQKISEPHCPRCLSYTASGTQCSFCAQGGLEDIDRAYAPFRHREEARELVLRLKFGPFEEAGPPLADAMSFAISGCQFDAMVPVPLHRNRLRERGFNQAEMLCRLVQRRRPDLALINALERYGKTRRQSSLQKGDRFQNVHGKFRALTRVDGKKILLVDDVRTTGATAQECARMLKEAGAASVSLLTATVAE